MATIFSSARLVCASLLSLLLFASACHKCNPAPTCSTPATVRDLTGLDGCGKVLELSNGQRLEPVGTVWANFNATDGQRVRIAYQPISAVSICMVGQTVELSCISPAPANGN